jgi:hypothetical protein
MPKGENCAMRSILKPMLGVLAVLATAGLTAGPAAARELPKVVTLDALSELFEGVAFDHAMHVDLADSCGACHHHTTGEPADPQCAGCHQGQRQTAVACRACHPAQSFSADYLREKELDRGRHHLDKPGLKAAYHRNCLGCHEETGGPTGCVDCHARTEAGDALYRTGAFAPRPQGSATHAH